MKIATVTRDYNFLINGFVVKKFEKNKSYIMSEMLMKDIMHAGGNKLFAAIRDIDNSVYKKYNGENIRCKYLNSKDLHGYLLRMNIYDNEILFYKPNPADDANDNFAYKVSFELNFVAYL